MPELPEVESVRAQLEPAVLGRAVTGVRSSMPGFVRGDASPKALLAGASIASVERRGKQIAITGDSGRAIVIHLGMTGQILLLENQAAVRGFDHTHVVWRLGGDGPARLVFRDPRRFGGVWTYPSREDLVRDSWGKLGPEATTVRAEALAAILSRSRQPVKALLLDQSRIAGIVNIYADEACAKAGVNPHTPAREVHRAPELAKAIRQVLRAAIKAGGSSMRDYKQPSGSLGSFQNNHRVYGRGGEPCMSCGTRLEQTQVAQRTTVWCPACQPAPDALSTSADADLS